MSTIKFENNSMTKATLYKAEGNRAVGIQIDFNGQSLCKHFKKEDVNKLVGHLRLWLETGELEGEVMETKWRNDHEINTALNNIFTRLDDIDSRITTLSRRIQYSELEEKPNKLFCVVYNPNKAFVVEVKDVSEIYKSWQVQTATIYELKEEDAIKL